MRYVDIETWPRREHYKMFSGFNHPHFGLCANVDVTQLRRYLRVHRHSFTMAIVYLIARAANAIPEFRMRIRDAQVVEHEHVDPSFTIMTSEELFGFCTVRYLEEFPAFCSSAVEAMAEAKQHPNLQNPPGRDDLLYMTAMPWVAFTSLLHPMQQHPADSIPRFAFGKVFGDHEMRQMPLGVQGHHALMDGLHLGKFYTQVQDYLWHPDLVLSTKQQA